MLHILLTTIISYTLNIHSVNREYHNTFVYNDEYEYEGLHIRSCHRIAYNWRTNDHLKISSRIYNCEVVTDYFLPVNYY